MTTPSTAGTGSRFRERVPKTADTSPDFDAESLAAPDAEQGEFAIPADELPTAEIWTPVLRALGAEPQSVDAVRGASGLAHPVAAVGTDEAGRRLIVVSTELNARSAGLA